MIEVSVLLYIVTAYLISCYNEVNLYRLLNGLKTIISARVLRVLKFIINQTKKRF